MRNYSIADLLVDQYYSPISSNRRFNGGIINHAEKRENVWAGNNNQVFAIRYRPTESLNDNWATVSVRTED